MQPNTAGVRTLNRAPNLSANFAKFTKDYAILIAIILLGAVFAFSSPHFLTLINTRNILQQSTAIGIVAIGQALILLTGEFDLSLGQNVMVTSCLTAWLIKIGNVNPWFAVLIGIATGCFIGATNGYLIAYVRIPCFITTLGMQMICMGMGKIITNDSPIPSMPPEISWFGTKFIGGSRYGIPTSIIILILMYVIFSFLARKTKMGRNFYAMGGGQEAAYFAGIGVKAYRMLAYTLAGGLAALGGVVLLSRIDSAAVTSGNAYEFDAMIGCVIGGISLSGGKGKIVQALLGTIFLTLFFNGMTMLNVHPFIQNVLKGIVLILAVGIDTIRNKRK